MLETVRIPALYGGIFTSREDKVSVWHKRDCHDTVIVSKDRLVTVTEIQSPDTKVLIC